MAAAACSSEIAIALIDDGVAECGEVAEGFLFDLTQGGMAFDNGSQLWEGIEICIECAQENLNARQSRNVQAEYDVARKRPQAASYRACRTCYTG